MEGVRNPILNAALREARDNMGIEYPSGVIALQAQCGLDAEKAIALNAYYLAQCLNRIETIQNMELLSGEQRTNFERQLVNNYTNPGPEQVWFEAFRGNSNDMPIFQLLDRLTEEGFYGGT